MTCEYRKLNGTLCGRAVASSGGRCIFHFWSDEQLASTANAAMRAQFARELERLIEAGDGQWEGFVFPERWIRSGTRFGFDVDARRARFADVELTDVEFAQKADFSSADFRGSTTLTEVRFLDEASFAHGHFGGPLELQRVRFLRSTSFHRANFGDSVLFRAYCAAHASFAEASFARSVNFNGWRNITMHAEAGTLGVTALGVGIQLSSGGATSTHGRLRRVLYASARVAANCFKRCTRAVGHTVTKLITVFREAVSRLRHRYRRSSPDTAVFMVFGGEVEFTSVNFLSPSLVGFSDVDLSKAYLRGTNFRGARFLNINWWQPRLRRNGLYDDLFIARSTDGAFRWRYLPVLEETYRNVRVALEDSRS